MHNIPDAPTIEGATHLHPGKVRDLYRLDDGHLLMVASDRISAYDFVLDTTIPDKGEILTRMSLWWFDQLDGLVPNHVVSTDVPAAVRGRAVVCEDLQMFPVECVARGYLTGSGLREYDATGEVCGLALPAGLVDGSRLPEPVFTPATKAELGDHDENVSYDAVVAQVGPETAAELRRLTLAVAAWFRYLSGKAEDGSEFTISNTDEIDIENLQAKARDGGKLPTNLMSIKNLFGDDLRDDVPFMVELTKALDSLYMRGAKKTMEDYA